MITCLSKRDEKLVNNQWAAGHSVLLFKSPSIVQNPMYLVERYLNLIIPVFVLPHLCHHPYMATPPSLIQASLRHRWVPGHVPCQTDPKLFGNRINSIAFVAAKHQTPISVSNHCCLWARTGQGCLPAPLRVLEVVAESQLEVFSQEVSSEQVEVSEEQEKHKKQTESSSCNTQRVARRKAGNTDRGPCPRK